MGRTIDIVLVLVLGCLVQLGTAMAAPEGPRVAVLELQASKLSREMVALLSDKVREGVLVSTRGKNVTIMSRENMATIAKDMGLDLACIEGECEVETGRNIGAAYVVSGVVVDVGGGLWVCTIKIHRTDSGALLATGDVRGGQPASLIDRLSPKVQSLMSDAFGGGASQSTMQLGGEDVDFAGQAAAAGQGRVGSAGAVGEATLELGSGGDDIAALARRARVKTAERERVAAEEAQLQAQLKAARARAMDKAKAELKEKARRDYTPLAALLQGPMSDESVSLLERYVRRYSSAKVTVHGETAPVTVYQVARIQRSLVKEENRRQTEVREARQRKIDAARKKLLVQAAMDYAAIKPLLSSAATAETRLALQAFVRRYRGARIRVDEVQVEVEVPGLVAVEGALRKGSARPRDPLAEPERVRSAQQPQSDREVAENAGVLQAWDNAPTEAQGALGSSTQFDSTLIGGIGGLIGAKGTPIGAGGLGARGSGLGGGGTAAGLGGLGTKGRGSGASGYGSGGRNFGAKGSGGIARIGGDPIILGALDKSLIDRVIKRHMNQIKYCYQRELNKNPTLRGKITVKFAISPSGSVSQATTHSSSMTNRSVETCINSRFMRFQFPEPRGGGIVIVKYPFLFSPN